MAPCPSSLECSFNSCSLGGLGKDYSLACVSDVVAENIIVQNALYGVRIKTWQVKHKHVQDVLYRIITSNEQ
jgi:hypothetical protein